MLVITLTKIGFRINIFSAKEAAMAKKIGYFSTMLVAVWGLVYYPLHCIAAVKPFTPNQTFWDALQALQFSPLYGIALLSAALVIQKIIAAHSKGPTHT